MNAPLVAGILSAVVPPLIGLIGLFVSADRQPRDTKRIVALAEAMKNLDPKSHSGGAVDGLITAIASSATQREKGRRPVNPTNVGLTIAFSAMGGIGSYLLFLWAMSADSLAGLAWTLFAIVAALTLLLVAGGLGTWRNPGSK